MQLPLQVAFRDMEHSAAVEALVREKASGLDRFAGDLTSCRVVVGPAGKHHRKGNRIDVRIDLTVPGEEIAITREPGRHTKCMNVHTALREAFDSARRKLEDYERRKRGAEKVHAVPPHGRVRRLFPAEGFGIIRTPDGREVYFHRRSVVGEPFDNLRVGTEVVFVEQEGEKGPQASTVRPVGRHHLQPDVGVS